MTASTTTKPVRGSTWLSLDDTHQVTCTVDHDEDVARVTVFGPIEVDLEMPREVARRWRDVLDAALAEAR
ncbi:hypothetical protein [Saccharothrix sp. Mg75]|uniref:hypothetical protein n=1 Tax=Saccharothrix sp. Mg75 TaxID=3445357 RepID=UPI003EEDD002